MARVNTDLFVELLNNFFSKTGSSAVAEDVEGGSVSYKQGGIEFSHLVHVQVSLWEHYFYISFAAETPISIDKRLFQLSTEGSEGSRKKLIGDIEKIFAWHLTRKKEGVILNFSFAKAKRKAAVKGDDTPIALARPAGSMPVPKAKNQAVTVKSATAQPPVRREATVPASMQRGKKLGT